MTTVSTKTFLENPTHFFNLARKQDLAIKRGKMIFRITPEPQENCAWTALSKRFGWTIEELKSISPSRDPFWDDPRNVEELLQSKKDSAEGRNPVVATLLPEDDVAKFLELLFGDV